MAQVFYSINKFPGNGSQTTYEISFAGGYISKAHVSAKVVDALGNEVPVSFTWSGQYTIVLSNAVPVGSTLYVSRSTPRDKPLADFSDGAVVTEINLDINAKQAVFIAAEAIDAAYIPNKGDKGDKGDPGTTSTGSGESALFVEAAGMPVTAGVTAIRTSGYSIPGLGGARYIYDSTINAAYVSSHARTAFIAQDGRGFRLDPFQTLRASMFGNKPDFTGNEATATDNYNALMEAMAFRSPLAIGYGSKIYLDPGKSYTSKTLNPGGYIDIEGAAMGIHMAGPQPEGAPSWIVAPKNTTVIRLKSQSVSNAFSRVSSLVLAQVTQGNDLSAHGVHATCGVYLKSLSYVNISGDGERIEAWIDGSYPITDPRWGEASNWVSEDCFAHSVGGNGHYAQGADTNIGRCIGFRTQVCGLAGIRDNSYYTNIYMQCHLAGYGTGGVFYNGRNWQSIGDSRNVAPGTNRPSSPWYDRGAATAPSTRFPAWSATTTYLATGPVIATNPATFVGIYIEGEGAYGYSHAPRGVVHGPNMGWTHFTNFSAISPTGVGYNRGTGGDITHPAYAAVGEGEFGTLGYRGDDRPVTQKSAVLFFGDGVAGTTALDWENNNSSLTLRRFNQPEFYSLSYGKDAIKSSTRKAPILNQIVINGYSLKDPGNANSIINIQVGNPPTTGECGRGDRVFNPNPSPGGVDYWVCVQGGAISQGPWTSGEYNVIGDVRQSDNKAWVLSKRGATGQVFTAPMGTVTFTDPNGGAVWEPVMQAFVWKAVNLPA